MRRSDGRAGKRRRRAMRPCGGSAISRKNAGRGGRVDGTKQTVHVVASCHRPWERWVRETNYVMRQVAALLGYAKSAVIERSRRLVRRRSAGRTAFDREAVTELIGLTDNLLRQYGQVIEVADGTTRCFATDEFLVATYTVEPGLALYQISQHDHGENISQVFVATWYSASGTPDLNFYRDGPWRRRFWSFADNSLDPGPARVLH